MRVALLVAWVVLAASCGSDSSRSVEIDVAASLVRLGGTVCRVDLIAGGVFIEPGFVLTAAHPVAGSTEDIVVETLDGMVGTGRIVGFDPERDLALLEVVGVQGVALELAAATVSQRGSIWTIDRSLELELVGYEVDGLINATGDNIYGEGDVSRRALQLLAEVKPGMSGSPVVGDLGQLLGIVFADSRQKAIAYAVAASEVKAFLSEIDRETPVSSGRCA